jgi:hypothetical protein
MSLAGSLSTMPLADLLQWVHSTRKTGVLFVETPDDTTTLYLKDGKVISSSSTDPRSYLGQFLLAHTRVTEEDLRRAFERQERTKVYLGKNIYVKTLLGKILLDEGILGEEEITHVLRLKTEETIYNLFLCNEGSFRLIVNELPPEELVPISIDVLEVLHRGIQRADAWNNVRARVPSNRAVFRVFTDRVPADLKLGEFESKIVLLLSEGRTVLDVILALHSTEFAVNQAIFQFLRSGFVELDHEEPTTPPSLGDPALSTDPPDRLVEKGRQLFDQRCYADTVIAARQALRHDPTHPEARLLLERSERELTDSFYARVCSPVDIPHLKQPLEELDLARLSPEERFLIERVNGSWSIGAIVKLSPIKEVDALFLFKKLLDDGAVWIQRVG